MVDFAAISMDAFWTYGFKVSAFLVGLAALIFVHELGHFLIARKCGVTVEKFSIGFGPKIVGFKSGGTEYLIAAIPLGGYVKMKGEDPGEEVEDTQGSFSASPVHHRLAIAFGGPLFNFLFAILIYTSIFLVGTSVNGASVGNIHDNSPALAAGLKTGDRIIEIDGKKILYWRQMTSIVRNSPGKSLNFVVERDDKTTFSVDITPRSDEVSDLFGDKEKVGLIGIEYLERTIAHIGKGTPAELAGFQVGDDIVSVDGTEIRGGSDLQKSARTKPGQELTFQILRNGQPLELKLTPESKTVKNLQGEDVTVGFLGLAITGLMVTEQHSLPGAVRRGLESTWDGIALISISIQKLITGSISAKNIGGPIMIYQVYGSQAELGLSYFIMLTAFLSINLGLLNLLPIPILDGGHIMFYLIELIKGKPVSERNRERAAQVGLLMLLSLMVFAFYNDIVRVIS